MWIQTAGQYDAIPKIIFEKGFFERNQQKKNPKNTQKTPKQ